MMFYTGYRSRPIIASGSLQRTRPVIEGENLTGQVNGKRASALEERFYRGTTKDSRIQWVRFKSIYGAPSNMFGSIELDFLIFTGSFYLVQIDGAWIHKSAQARMHDIMQDERLFHDHFRTRNAQPVSRVTEKFLSDQNKANDTVRQILAGRVFKADD